MERQPGDDMSPASTAAEPAGHLSGWETLPAHRDPADPGRAGVLTRLQDAGLTPQDVLAALRDAGDALHEQATSAEADWTRQVGGPLAVALLAAEVGALAAHLGTRAAAVRSRAVTELLDDYSAVAVAEALGVSRQKVYDIAREVDRPPFIRTSPWRQP
jgi:hypothetical protein